MQQQQQQQQQQHGVGSLPIVSGAVSGAGLLSLNGNIPGMTRTKVSL